MKKHTTTWVVVADSHNVKIFQSDEKFSEPLALVKEIILATEANPPKGRSFDRMGAGRHAIEPHTDFKEVERQHLAAEVEKFLQQSLTQNQFQNLILVAPHKMFETLDEKLSEQVKQKVVRELRKNISEFSAAELREYFLQKE